VKKDVFQKYPQLLTLRGKVPDEVVEREVSQKEKLFKKYSSLAQQRIPAVRLCDVFPADLEKGKVTLENFLGFWGNVSIEEVCKIGLIIAWFKPKMIFEFGTYNGLTTLQMAINSPPGCRIYTLDIPPDSAFARLLDIGEIDRCLAVKKGAFNFAVGFYFKGSAFSTKIIQLWHDSLKADLSCYGQQFDIIFIDAGHTYPYIKTDTENALKMLRPEGIIIWHDYLQLLYPDVTHCLYDFSIGGLNIYHLRGTNLALYYKKPSKKAVLARQM